MMKISQMINTVEEDNDEYSIINSYVERTAKDSIYTIDEYDDEQHSTLKASKIKKQFRKSIDSLGSMFNRLSKTPPQEEVTKEVSDAAETIMELAHPRPVKYISSDDIHVGHLLVRPGCKPGHVSCEKDITFDYSIDYPVKVLIFQEGNDKPTKIDTYGQLIAYCHEYEYTLPSNKKRVRNMARGIIVSRNEYIKKYNKKRSLF